MSKLKERIEALSPYFKAIEIRGEYLIVKVNFPARWMTYPNDEQTVLVAANTENASAEGSYIYYASSNEMDFDSIFDLIEDTIRVNEETIKKVKLLKDKVEELKQIFADSSITYAQLEGLTFTLGTDKPKKPRKYTKKAKKVEEQPIQEENTVEVEEAVEK